MKGIKTTLLAFILVSIFSVQADAAQVLSINLEKTVSGADVAFSGVCTKAYAHKLDNGLLATTYDFNVLDDLKGNVADTFSFTQWGATLEDSKKYAAPYIYGMPKYSVGDEYLVFLTAETSLGLRAPVGLGQGKFNIIRASNGTKTVKNDHNNRSIFSDLKMTKGMVKNLKASSISTTSPGPMNYDAFVNIVKDLEKGE
ncbi:MAG: hypothetical protein HN337_06220 [Deltaproteobacteria bacterium]|jgi:hypothetical protein|nr:hypothetical protein [Deltaproteobacteria bacterium]